MLTVNDVELDDFTRVYLEAALWSSNDESDPETGGNPLDYNYSIEDFALVAIREAVEDCQDFQKCFGHLLTEENSLRYGPDCENILQRAGFDFWLTRNHHGAGFWDGDWKEPAATRLTEGSHTYGEVHPYVGDDGFIYFE